jgi:hypothetical protein
VTIPLWCEGKGLAVDVAVTCPFSSSNLSRDSPAEYCAKHLKHNKYDAGFVGKNFDFSALVFESTGAVNREGKEFLTQLFRFAARYSGSPLSVFAGRAWARLSCVLQSAVAQSIINRDPGEEPSSPSPDAEDSTLPSFSIGLEVCDHVPALPGSFANAPSSPIAADHVLPGPAALFIAPIYRWSGPSCPWCCL